MGGGGAPRGGRPPARRGGGARRAPAGRDALCASIASSIEAGPLGATGWARPVPLPLTKQAAAGEIALAVCGAHMAGLPLNRELVERGGRFIRAASTAPVYRLHALAGGPPFRPGLVRTTRGAAIALEVWALPRERFGDFIAGVPAPLCIGTVELEDGTTVKGFLCEEAGLAGAADITEFGGWRAWLARPKAEAAA